MVMVFVPGGTFPMGSLADDAMAADDESPQHLVTLDGFWIDRTEVTNAQYDNCVETGTCSPSGTAGDEERTGPNFPVEAVTWENAATYCEWAGGRLPTEAEWEYAARGPEGRIYPWGDQAPTPELCQFDNNVIGTAAAGSFPAGASWCDALDLAGNVEEWVADWYSETYYQGSPTDNPAGPETGEFKVVRGGSWGTGPAGVRGADRSRQLPPEHMYGGLGFRCAASQPDGE
jgi:formylglycine-generating enzyme required for sulfatase activity